MDQSQRDSVNGAILKFDPEAAADSETLHAGAKKWWGLSGEQAEKLISVWRGRAKIDKRVNLSRKALLNLLPWIRDHCQSVSEARQNFAGDASNGASAATGFGYALDRISISKSDRQFLRSIRTCSLQRQLWQIRSCQGHSRSPPSYHRIPPRI